MLKKHYRKKNLNKIDDVNLNFELNVDPFQSATCMEMSWKKNTCWKNTQQRLIGAFPSLHIKYHHQRVYSKLNLNVVYPTPYQRLVWDYKKPNVYCLVYLDFLISVENIHQQAQYLNEILVNAFSNYIPNKWIIIDDNDLSWMNEI